MNYSPVRVIVEFMDGQIRTYEPAGGFAEAPTFGGTRKHGVTLDMVFKGGPAAPIKHVAGLPLANIREYRVEAMR